MQSSDETKPQPRIGIFAGSFDPVHDGHIAFALQALEACSMDKVYFLVEPRPRHKQGVKALVHRERMVQLATAHDRRLGSIHLADARFTIHETLPHISKRLHGAELYMLAGDDVVRHLAAWPHIDELISAVHFIVGVRAPKQPAIEESLQTLQLTRGSKLHYSVLAVPDDCQVSSTLMRRQLRHTKSAEALDPAVLAYIHREKLYM
jgi:nicotinate-nucleotide adenylyltransferase